MSASSRLTRADRPPSDEEQAANITTARTSADMRVAVARASVDLERNDRCAVCRIMVLHQSFPRDCHVVTRRSWPRQARRFHGGEHGERGDCRGTRPTGRRRRPPGRVAAGTRAHGPGSDWCVRFPAMTRPGGPAESDPSGDSAGPVGLGSGVRRTRSMTRSRDRSQASARSLPRAPASPRPPAAPAPPCLMFSVRSGASASPGCKNAAPL